MAYEYLTVHTWVFRFVSLFPFCCWWQVLLCSGSWQSNKIRFSWRPSDLGWTFFKAENKGKLSSLYFCWRGKVSIHHFHIDHNAPCLPPKFWMTIVSLVLQSSKGNRRQWWYKIWWVNNLHYGLCENGECKNIYKLRWVCETRISSYTYAVYS